MGGLSEKPRLLFFYSTRDGRCRKVEAYLAQVLQNRSNHDSFRVYRVPWEQRPDLHVRFRVEQVPELAVVEDKQVVARLIRVRSVPQIESFLAPWLRAPKQRTSG